jgi:hypothetical protein
MRVGLGCFDVQRCAGGHRGSMLGYSRAVFESCSGWWVALSSRNWRSVHSVRRGGQDRRFAAVCRLLGNGRCRVESRHLVDPLSPFLRRSPRLSPTSSPVWAASVGVGAGVGILLEW